MLIGITGCAGSGKDTVADIITEKSNFVKRGFSYPLKDVCKIFGFTDEQLTDHTLKEKVDEYWNITPRKFMQITGTEMFRYKFRYDVWIKLMNMFVENNKHVVIPDVRFENEAVYVKSKGIIIKVVRYNNIFQTKENKHLSETPLKDKYIDYVVENNSGYKELKEKIFKITECEELI